MKLQGWRKLILGLFFIIENSLLTAQVIYSVPAEQIPAVIGALAAKMGAEVVGMGAIIYGNVKEHQSNGANS